MANTRFYLDERRTKNGNPCILKIGLAHKGGSAYISLDAKLFPHQWDDIKEKVVDHPSEQVLNVYIAGVKQRVDYIILNLTNEGKLHSMSVTEVKNYILDQLNPERLQKKQEEERVSKSFAFRFVRFAESKKKSTRSVYMQTYHRMVAYIGEDKLKQLAFEDITKEWLTSFEQFLALTAPSKNARNIHLRNIRSVFNEAIDDEITTFYPFRRFKIRPVATRKRSLKVEDLRILFNYPVEPYAVKHLDMFKLMFFLIGINGIDLYNLRKIEDGRITYYRAKTNRLYSIKVEPEALEIINKYRSKSKDFLLDIHESYKRHEDYLKKMNTALKRIGPVKRKGRGGKKFIEPLFPELSSYWARHTWASIASSLDISRDVIAHALGHGNNTVTDIYIDFDERKVDEANRRVIDWVLYGKR